MEYDGPEHVLRLNSLAVPGTQSHRGGIHKSSIMLELKAALGWNSVHVCVEVFVHLQSNLLFYSLNSFLEKLTNDQKMFLPLWSDSEFCKHLRLPFTLPVFFCFTSFNFAIRDGKKWIWDVSQQRNQHVDVCQQEHMAVMFEPLHTFGYESKPTVEFSCTEIRWFISFSNESSYSIQRWPFLWLRAFFFCPNGIPQEWIDFLAMTLACSSLTHGNDVCQWDSGGQTPKMQTCYYRSQCSTCREEFLDVKYVFQAHLNSPLRQLL